MGNTAKRPMPKGTEGDAELVREEDEGSSTGPLSDETEQKPGLLVEDAPADDEPAAFKTTEPSTTTERMSLVKGNSAGTDHHFDSFVSTEKTQRRKHPRLECLLPSDTYSFFTSGDYFSAQYSTCFCSLTFLTAIGVMIIQITTMSLLLADVLDHDEVDNPLGIPGGADFAVRCTQVLALFIAVVSQDEVRLSLNLMTHGYDPQLLREQIYPRISMTKWMGSLLARLGVGCFGLILTFVLIVRAETVRDLLLDFTAIEFVLALDNALFLLARWGYMAQELQEQADLIAYTHHPLDESTKGQKWKRLWRVLFLMGIFGAMVGSWGYIVKQQNDGKYLYQAFFVQFSDDYNSAMSAFSGIYIYHGHEGHLGNEYAYYKPSAQLSPFAGRAKFGFCHSQTAWAFSYDDTDADDVCRHAKALSPRTLSFDITKRNTLWSVVDERSQLKHPLQHFFLTALDVYDGKSCRSNKHCGSSGRFMCEDNQCVCTPAWFGLNCEFEAPCETMEVDEQFGIFADTRPRSTEYSLLRMVETNRIVTLHHRPVYASDKTPDGSFDLILFTGRRWVLSNTNRFEDFSQLTAQNLTKTTLASFFGHGLFHAFWSDYSVLFISEAIDANTPSDATSPVGIRWYHAQASNQEGDASKKTSLQTANTNRESNAVLLCGICSESNPCFYGNSCGADGLCVCSTGSSGRLCHLAPISNGKCDPFFNDAEFLYDGGDCCQKSCESSDQHGCGMSTSQSTFSFPRYIGFNNCADPESLCPSGVGPCWNQVYNLLGTERGTMSGNGAVIAFDSVPAKVYEQNGATLFSRQIDFNNDDELFGGKTFAMTPDASILAMGFRRFSQTENPVAVVQVYTYEHRFRRYRVLGSNYGTLSVTTSRDGFSYGPAVALSKDGLTVAIGAPEAASSDTIAYVRVYKFDVDRYGYTWQQIGNTIEGTGAYDDHLGCRVALSDDGATLVASSPRANEGAGYVDVYRFEDGNWTIVSRMEGKIGPSLTSHQADWFGGSISLSGSTLAIAAPRNYNGGYVQIYDYDESKDDWILTKQLNATSDQEGYGESFGESVALSNNGLLVVGSPFADSDIGLGNGRVSVFQRPKDSFDWIPYLDALQGDEPFETMGYVVGISGDGSTIMAGSAGNNFRVAETGSNGKVQLYHVDVTSDGKMQDEDPESPFVNVSILVHLDQFPEQVGIELACEGGPSVLVPVGSFAEPRFTYQETWHVPQDATCTFTIFDPFDDGICCTYGSGSYSIFFGTDVTNDAMLLAQGGKLFGSKEKVTFHAAQPPAISRVSIDLESGEFANEDSVFTFVCDGFLESVITAENGFRNKGTTMQDTFLIPDGTECSMTLYDAGCNGGKFRIWYGDHDDALGPDTIAHSDGVGCGTSVSFAVSPNPISPIVTGLCSVQFYMRLDNYPSETGWSFTCDDKTLAEFPAGHYSDGDISEQKMFEGVANGTECTLLITDSYGDGLLDNGNYGLIIGWNGDHLLDVSSPGFGYNETHIIAVNC